MLPFNLMGGAMRLIISGAFSVATCLVALNTGLAQPLDIAGTWFCVQNCRCAPQQTNPSIGQENVQLTLTNECFEGTYATLTDITIVIGQPVGGGPAWNSGDGTVLSNQQTGKPASRISFQNGTIWCHYTQVLDPYC
jgi:hypothetical protein